MGSVILFGLAFGRRAQGGELLRRCVSTLFEDGWGPINPVYVRGARLRVDDIAGAHGEDRVLTRC
jgi:hypothetical protein